jgi:hypothetical protein
MCRIFFAILLGFCTAADIASAEEAEAWTASRPACRPKCHTDARVAAATLAAFRVDDLAPPNLLQLY